MRSGPVRVALVGVGRWGVNHLRLLAERDGATRRDALVVAVDADPEARRRGLRICPELRVESELDAALGEDVDAIVVATPPETHAELARRALLAGKHVLVEKPLCTCPAAARELAATAHARGLVLHTGHLMLHHPAYERLREIARAERPRALYAERDGVARGPIDPVEVLWSLGPHDLAWALTLLGDDLGLDEVRPSEAGVTLELRRAGGASARVQLRRTPAPARRGCVVTTDAARYELDEQDGSLRAHPNDGPSSSWRDPSARPLARQLDAFVRRIASGSALDAPADPGPRVVELLREAESELSRAVNARHTPSNEASLPMVSAAPPG